MQTIARSTLLAGVFACAVAVAGVTEGAVIVNYSSSNNYNTSTSPLSYEGFASQTSNSALANFDGDAGTDDDIVVGRPFSTTVQMNPQSVNYNTSLPSAVFYGGYVVQTLNTTSTGSAKLWDSMRVTSGDEIEADSSGAGTGVNFSTHIAQYWDQANFLNGGSGAPIVLDNTSQFTFTTKQANANAPIWTLRWMVRDGSTFYISESVISVNQNTTHTSPLNAFSSTSDGNWAVYDPFGNSPSGVGTGGLDVDFESVGASFQDRNFTNITGIGFYVEIDGHDDANKKLNIASFGVNAVVVPEGPVAAYLGLSALLGGTLWWRRRRQATKPLEAGEACGAGSLA